jgi:hypothetical protein
MVLSTLRIELKVGFYLYFALPMHTIWVDVSLTLQLQLVVVVVVVVVGCLDSWFRSSNELNMNPQINSFHHDPTTTFLRLLVQRYAFQLQR